MNEEMYEVMTDMAERWHMDILMDCMMLHDLIVLTMKRCIRDIVTVAFSHYLCFFNRRSVTLLLLVMTTFSYHFYLVGMGK